VWKDKYMRVNVSDFLREAAERAPHDEALVEYHTQRRSLTWAQFAAEAEHLSRALSAHGLVAGHRVALVMANGIDLAIAYYAVLQRGYVAVPMNPRATPDEIHWMLADSGSRIVLTDTTGFANVRDAGDVLVVGDDETSPAGTRHMTWREFLADATDSAAAAPADPEALAVLLYTSGSTGSPRAAMLSHRALIANINQIGRITPPPLSADDVCLVLLPLFHIYGLNAILGQAVAMGARCVFVDGFDPDAVLQLIVDEQITNVPVAPPVIAAWAGRDNLAGYLHGVRTILSGASALDPDLAVDFERSCGKVVDQGYGLTEAAPVIATTLGGPDPDHGGQHGVRPQAGSVGKPLPGIEMKIIEPAGTEAKRGDPAQIWVRGPNLFSGFWPDGSDGPRADGWFATGDVGYIDDSGDLTLVDRVRELVIVSGFNVYPREVENVIEQLPGVSQVAVVGVPDAVTGEAVLAYVVPEPDHDAATEATEHHIIEHCRTRLARFKQPKRVILVDYLPKSATGKIAKGRLRALARSTELGLDGP